MKPIDKAESLTHKVEQSSLYEGTPKLWSTKVIKQKLDYIHNNPLKAGFVTNPIHWKWSSARNIAEEDFAMEIDDIGFFG